MPDGPDPAGRLELQRAIDLAARGCYQQSLGIARLLYGWNDPGTQSAADCLQASIMRQLHQHARAEVFDHRALAAAVGPQTSDTRIDALVGLAADVIADVDEANRRWTAVEAWLARASVRSRVRGRWVGAEVHLAAGDPARAVGLAADALAEAPQVSARHLAKSQLILGVTWCCAGEPKVGVALVRQAAVGAARDRLRPLLWASAQVLGSWLPEPAAGRWRTWAADVVRSIGAGLDPDLASGWRGDPAVAALWDSRR